MFTDLDMIDQHRAVFKSWHDSEISKSHYSGLKDIESGELVGIVCEVTNRGNIVEYTI